MLPRHPGEPEEWLRRPFEWPSPDPRFAARRARLDEFPRIYALVDDVFGVRRPRSLYQWLYERNPLGRAWCWTVVERRSGRLLGAVGCWPWPLARGERAIEAWLTGDSVVRPDCQRLGVGALRYASWKDDPLSRRGTVVGWPNEISERWLRKQGYGAEILGPLAEAAADLSPGRRWRRPGALLRRAAARRPRRPGLRVAEVDRFDAEFDGVTQRCAQWKGFWSAPDADFLNWRYRSHPTRSYRILTAREGERLAAWAVLRDSGRDARLMEFVAPDDAELTAALLEAVRKAAREAGCRRLSTFATPAWRRWPALRRAGLAPRPSSRHMYLSAPRGADAFQLATWQLLPGDTDCE